MRVGSYGPKWLLWPGHCWSIHCSLIHHTLLGLGGSLSEGRGLLPMGSLHACFFPCVTSGHRGAPQEGIQPQPPDPTASTPDPGGEGKAREDADTAQPAARYAAHRHAGQSTVHSDQLEAEGQGGAQGQEARVMMSLALPPTGSV